MQRRKRQQDDVPKRALCSYREEFYFGKSTVFFSNALLLSGILGLQKEQKLSEPSFVHTFAFFLRRWQSTEKGAANKNISLHAHQNKKHP